MSVGNLPDVDIIKGLDTVTLKTQQTLKKKFGAEFKVESFNVATHHQVAADNKTINLKCATRAIRLRRGFFQGADVRLQWKDDRKEAVEILVSCGTLAQAVLFYLCIGFALCSGGLFVFQTNFAYSRDFGYLVWFIFFILFLVPALIPYVVYWLFSRIQNRTLVNDVFTLLSQSKS